MPSFMPYTGLPSAAMAMQRLQHEAVAAERDEHVGILGRVLAVLRDQRAERVLRVRRSWLARKAMRGWLGSVIGGSGSCCRA